MSTTTQGAADHANLPASTQFPPMQSWPVMPPDEHWLKRWHWLRDDEGDPFLASWHWKFGWHFGWSGKADPEDMEGWAYIEVARQP